jgi:thiamine biosynthesis lipoprotein
LYACDSEVANNAAKAAFERIQELNQVFSDYTADSELRQLCERSGPGRPVPISDDLLAVIKESLRLSRESNGAFDITVGPLTKLWRRARRQKLLPKEEALASAMSLVGYEMIRLNRDCQTVELLQTGMRLDLGGIAKGRAADEALKVLRSHGIRRALVDASGDLVAGDPPPGRNGWIVDVANLDPERSASAARIELANYAVATSGDAFQSVEIAGRRYSHIVNPRTGFGLSRRSSVTVIAPTGMAADSLASALSVLNAEAGLALLRKRGESRFAALLVLADAAPAGPPRVIRSRCFAKYEVSPAVK